MIVTLAPKSIWLTSRSTDPNSEPKGLSTFTAENSCLIVRSEATPVLLFQLSAPTSINELAVAKLDAELTKFKVVSRKTELPLIEPLDSAVCVSLVLNELTCRNPFPYWVLKLSNHDNFTLCSFCKACQGKDQQRQCELRNWRVGICKHVHMKILK